MTQYLFRFGIAASAFGCGLAAVVFICLRAASLPEIPAPSEPETLAPAPVATYRRTSFPGRARKIAEIAKGRSGYFPRGLFGERLPPDDSSGGWYAKYLRAMGEKSMLEAAGEDREAFRFLWLRTFHHPIFVRVERGRGEIELFAAEFDGAGGYRTGRLLRNVETRLAEEDYERLVALVETSDFWNLPTEDEASGNDGAQWLLEAVRGGRYHVVDRWSPTDGAYREACLYLLKLSGFEADRLHDELY